MDAITHIVEHIVRTGYDDLPPESVESAKRQVLDSLATAMGGARKPGVGELVAMVKEWGGTEQSSIIGYGFKCPAPHAAQVNSSMIHSLDYDDGHPVALVHMGTLTVSTCFAMAERQGGLDGKALITALALGGDVLARLGLASRPNSSLISGGFHPTTLFGVLGAAAMAGKIMGLEAQTLIHAVGLAYHQCGGAGAGVKDGALAKRMGPGMAVKAGICAALMARQGITGDCHPLEGPTGLFKLYMGGDYDISILLSKLGERFENVNIGDKPYPCCGLTHACIDAALALRSGHDPDLDQIKEIHLYVGSSAYDLTQPIDVKRHPRTIVDAQFSVPYVVATALVKGKVTLEDFTEQGIQNAAVLALTPKIVAHHDPALDRHGVEPGKVALMMADGRELSEYVEFCKGTVQNPMTFDDCAAKFRECAPFAIHPPAGDRIEHIIERIGNLENEADATQIIRMLG